MSLPVDTGGCGSYRVRQPLQMINDYTSSETHVIDINEDDMLSLADALTNTDILIVRQGGEIGLGRLRNDIEEYSRATKRGNGLKAKIVYDIDDNIELISPYSEHFKGYGTYEYTDPDTGIKVWEDGKSEFFIEENKKRVSSLIKGLIHADLVTVTTEKLRLYRLAQYPLHTQ